jgi:hypothetical protein
LLLLVVVAVVVAVVVVAAAAAAALLSLCLIPQSYSSEPTPSSSKPVGESIEDEFENDFEAFHQSQLPPDDENVEDTVYYDKNAGANAS